MFGEMGWNQEYDGIKEHHVSTMDSKVSIMLIIIVGEEKKQPVRLHVYYKRDHDGEWLTHKKGKQNGRRQSRCNIGCISTTAVAL